MKGYSGYIEFVVGIVGFIKVFLMMYYENIFLFLYYLDSMSSKDSKRLNLFICIRLEVWEEF